MYTYEMDSTKLLSSKIEMINVLLFNLVNKHGETFAKCSEIVANGLKNDKTIFWCGNGGSAAESSHLAVELIGRFKNNRRSLPSLSLNADTSAITCIANDFGYDEIFARQLEGLGKQGDVLIVLSSSGKSENILRVLQKAKEMGITSIALLGKGGGQAVGLSDFAIVIESDETARIQELHLLLGHTLCEYAEIALGIA
jgi:D-sedoheptulose 7-phosphate isomerase